MALSFCDGLVASLGLMPHHAYGLLSVSLVTLKTDKKVRLVRIHNPWGGCVGWKGNWCNADSDSWALEIKAARRKNIRDHLQYHPVEPDGTFFMHVCHVARYIKRLDVAPE